MARSKKGTKPPTRTRTKKGISTSTGTRTSPSRFASTNARRAIASHYGIPHRSDAVTGPRTPPLNRADCLCHREVRRDEYREACWHCQRWHHMRAVVLYPTIAASPVDSCIYVWLWPRPQNPGPGEDPEPYRPCRLCRELTCHDPTKIPVGRRCPFCAKPFRPTGVEAQARWDEIFRSESFKAYVGRVLMEDGKGDWNLRKRLEEFDPDKFIRCRRELLGGPTGALPEGGKRLDAKHWRKWVSGTERRNQRWRDIILYVTRPRGKHGELDQWRPALYGISRLNFLAHTLEGNQDWDNFRDMFDDRSRRIE